MAKLNLADIRRQNANALKQYERFGTKLFTKALKEQAKNYDPKIMEKAYLDFYDKVFIDSVKKEYNRIRVREKVFAPSDFFLSMWKAWIQDWVLTNLGTIIASVNANTLSKIQETLAMATEQGLNPFMTARLLASQVGSITRARAIARTESTRANAMGKEQSANQWASESGQNLYKIWVWGGSREPRIQHIEAQNKPIPKDAFFQFTNPNGVQVAMLKPGDLSGGAAQTVNCSCTIVYISERFARRNYPETFTGQPVQGVPTLPTSPFRIANSLDEAKLISKEIIERNTPIRVKNTIFNNDLTLEQLNRANAQINKLTSQYNLSPHLKETSEITLLFNSSASSYGFVESYPLRISKINFGHKYDLKQRLNGSIYYGEDGRLRYAGKSQVDDINKEIATVTHEFAHVISSENKYIYRAFPQMESFWAEMTSLKRRYTTEANKLARSGNIEGLRNIYLGDYASRNKNEFMAEGFTEYKLKSNPSKYALEIGKLIDKYFKK